MSYYKKIKKAKKFQQGGMAPGSGVLAYEPEVATFDHNKVFGMGEYNPYVTGIPPVVAPQAGVSPINTQRPIVTPINAETSPAYPIPNEGENPGIVTPTKQVSNQELLDSLDEKMANAKDHDSIVQLQEALKVTPDGKWGPLSKAAFNRARRSLYLNTPEGKESDSRVRSVQRRLGVKVDGIWGPKTQAAYEKLKGLQGELGVKEDGLWGPKTKAAAVKRANEASDRVKTTFAGTEGEQLQTRPRMNTMTNSEARKKARGMRKDERKAKRAERKAGRTEAKRRGGLFYNTVEK